MQLLVGTLVKDHRKRKTTQTKLYKTTELKIHFNHLHLKQWSELTVVNNPPLISMPTC